MFYNTNSSTSERKSTETKINKPPVKIPDEDIMLIKSKYGELLEAIRPLNKSECVFFSGQDTFTPSLMVQTLYKIKSTHAAPPESDMKNIISEGYSSAKRTDAIVPILFKRMLRRFLFSNKAPRTSFIRTNDNIWAVELDSSLPLDTITFHLIDFDDSEALDKKLYEIMAAERHQNFELENIFLPRISVYRITSQEFAVLITQPQIIANAWDPVEFLKTLVHKDDLQEIKSVNKIDNTAKENTLEVNKQVDRKQFIEFWQKYLYELPAKPKIAKYYNENALTTDIGVHNVYFSGEETNTIKSVINNKERAVWIALSQTLWGINLQLINSCNDVHFPVLLPKKGTRIDNMNTSQLHNALPIRVKTSPNDIISNVVKKQFSQLLGAQPLGRPTREELIEITGNEEHYNHFISFQGFWTEGNSFSHVENVGISTVDSNVIDLGKDLAVYFHYNNNQLEIEAIYNANAIPPDAVAFLMKQFKNITSKLPACWNNTIEEMKELIVNNYQNNDNLTHNQAMALGSILSKFPLFANIPVLRINNLITNAHIAELSRGEIVQQINLPQKNIAFVVSGKVLRYREASDGWLNPLNVLKPTNVINEFAILEPNSNIYAEVVSNTAVIVFLSVKNVQKLLDEIPQFGSNFSKHLLKELNKYQKRWMTV